MSGHGQEVYSAALNIAGAGERNPAVREMNKTEGYPDGDLFLPSVKTKYNMSIMIG